jgi:hypothetical protein
MLKKCLETKVPLIEVYRPFQIADVERDMIDSSKHGFLGQDRLRIVFTPVVCKCTLSSASARVWSPKSKEAWDPALHTRFVFNIRPPEPVFETVLILQDSPVGPDRGSYSDHRSDPRTKKKRKTDEKD